MDLELLNEQQLFKNNNLRWMVFKVKQRSQGSYYDLVVPQAGEVSTTIDLPDSTEFSEGSARSKEKDYKLQFNWPYDYISIVESAKVKAEVLYKSEKKIITPTGKIVEDLAKSSMYSLSAATGSSMTTTDYSD